MKINIVLFSLIAMAFLGACQLNRQDTGNTGKANNTYQGPSDGGGGDTCNGKMIESYRVDVTSLEEYREYILPILEKITIKKDDKNKNNSSPFLLTPKMKNWYIIDCKLQDIPKERKGLYLETYQTAIHTSREIFIDSSSFNKMTKEEKAKLILHEMIMAYYLTKYLSLEDMCKMSSACSSDVSVVNNWKMFRPETYRPLNDIDHQRIRAITAWLWNQGDALNSQNFSQMLKNNEFDKRFDYEFNDEPEEIVVAPETLVRMFKKHEWSKSFPKFCQFDQKYGLSHSTCKTEVSADVRDYAPGSQLKKINVKVKLIRDSDQRTLENEFSYPIASDIRLYMNKFGAIVKAAPMFLFANWANFPGVTPVEGMRSQALFLMLNLSDINNPEIFQMTYQTYVWYSFEKEIKVEDGIKYEALYGYLNLLDVDTETLFLEKELPFSFRVGLSGKQLVMMKPAP